MSLPLSSVPIAELIQTLNSSVSSGLESRVAAERLEKQKEENHTTTRFQKEFRLFIRQFTSPLVLLLVIAVILSAILGEKTDTFIIFAILLLTGLLGFWQELNAGRAVEELQQLIKLKCSVIRNGQVLEIETDDVVAGDILLFKAGDIIPADSRIIECNELHINESTITGESYPVQKSTDIIPDDATITAKINCLWQGTSVVTGTGKAVAVYTGRNTVLGGMAHSLATVQETAFEKGIKHFGFFLMQITIMLSVVILAVNLYFKKPLFESVLFALAIAVGMTPELLPAIMTFAMSAGAKRMLRKKVIVKKLSSIFNFGEVNVLCTDKTGTITEGAIKVKEVIDVYDKPALLCRLYAYLNATLQNGFLNPVDNAIKKLNINIDGYSKTDEVPYDFIRKRLSVVVSANGKHIIITKGAVDNILEICHSQVGSNGDTVPLDEQTVSALYTSYCNNGFRLIAICYKETDIAQIAREDERDMIFMGFIVLEDPLKDDIVKSLGTLQKLDVSVKIITGDNRYVAAYVAKEIGITQPKILTGKDLNVMLPEALTVQAPQTDIFAEVEPYQKERIIKALQKSHLAVAYMGDGINDVAAIHAADTGISTNNAVDVARQAADFVLLEKDLSVLADGIIEGRKTFANSLKYIFITTGSTFGNMFSIAAASILLPFLPMLPKQILLTNFLTDLPFIAVSSDNVDVDQLGKPAKWNLKMIRNFMVVFGLHSSVFDFITFYMLFFYYHLKGSPFQTGWFIESVLTELFILFIMRTRKPFLKSKPGKWLRITGFVCFVVTMLLPVSPFAAPLGFSIAHFWQVVTIAFIVFFYIVTADILKIFFFNYNKNSNTAKR